MSITSNNPDATAMSVAVTKADRGGRADFRTNSGSSGADGSDTHAMIAQRIATTLIDEDTLRTMTEEHDYTFSDEPPFPPLERIDVAGIVDSCELEWFNRTLSDVNDCVIRLGIIKGEFHWHKHDDEDEFFYVVSGKLLIDLEEDRTVELSPQQGFMVPKGIVHRTRAPERTVMLMVEGNGVIPSGD